MSGACDIDLDALAFGELAAEAAASARAHLLRCEGCRREHERLCLERRLFSRRRRVVPSAVLPSFDALLTQARQSRPALARRWLDALRDSAAALRAATRRTVFAQGLVSLAVALVVALFIQRGTPRSSEPATDASRPGHTSSDQAGHEDRGAASQALPGSPLESETVVRFGDGTVDGAGAADACVDDTGPLAAGPAGIAPALLWVGVSCAEPSATLATHRSASACVRGSGEQGGTQLSSCAVRGPLDGTDLLSGMSVPGGA